MTPSQLYVFMPPNLGGFFMVRSYYPSECHADYFDFERIEALKPAIEACGISTLSQSPMLGFHKQMDNRIKLLEEILSFRMGRPQPLRGTKGKRKGARLWYVGGQQFNCRGFGPLIEEKLSLIFKLGASVFRMNFPILASLLVRLVGLITF